MCCWNTFVSGGRRPSLDDARDLSSSAAALDPAPAPASRASRAVRASRPRLLLNQLLSCCTVPVKGPSAAISAVRVANSAAPCGTALEVNSPFKCSSCASLTTKRAGFAAAAPSPCSSTAAAAPFHKGLTSCTFPLNLSRFIVVLCHPVLPHHLIYRSSIPLPVKRSTRFVKSFMFG